MVLGKLATYLGKYVNFDSYLKIYVQINVWPIKDSKAKNQNRKEVKENMREFFMTSE